MTLKKYNAAVIGLGNIGMQAEHDDCRPKPATHTGAYMLNNRIKHLGLCDVNISRHKNIPYLTKKISLVNSVKDLFNDEQYDIVSIATPKELHLEHITMAVDHGAKVIICEKPISDHLLSAIGVVKYCHEHKCVLVVNHVRRFLKHFMDIKDKIALGAIGDIQKVSCTYSGGVYESGTHLFDLLRYLFGNAHSAIATSCSNDSDPRIDGNLFFDQDISCFVQSLDGSFYNRFSLDIYGTEGSYKLDDMGFSVVCGKIVRSHMFSNVKVLHSAEKESFFVSSWSNLISHAIDCADGKDCISTGDDAVEAIRIIDTLKDSYSSGRKTHITAN